MMQSIVVLHVDDDRAFRDLVAQFLEQEDESIEVRTASSGPEALDRLVSESIDCVVSDFDMPQTDGLEFLDAVREEYGELPFILFTGKGSEAVASEAIARGATDYLQKQAGSEQYELLVNRIRNSVEQHEAEIERRRNERRFEAVFEDPQMLVALLGADGRLRAVNETAMRLVDQPHEELAGTYFWETPWWSDEIRDQVRTWIERAAEGEYIEYSDDRIHPEGRPGSARGTIRPVRDDEGAVTSLIVSARDTTGRVRAEQRFEAVFDHSRQYKELLDADGTVLEVNDQVTESYDVSEDDVIGGPFWEAPWWSGPEVRRRVREGVENAGDGTPVSLDLATALETQTAIEDLWIKPVENSEGRPVLLLAEWARSPDDSDRYGSL
jgi:PAS domain S-box-containing protein